MTIEKVKSICENKLKSLFLDSDPNYSERMKEELADLLVWEKIGVAKASRILDRVGNTPAAKTNKSASLVLFLLGLTEIDPVKSNLPLRRELVQCDSPPDIDTDFDPEIRDIVKAKVVEVFGKDKVCSIGTYQTYKTRAVIVEVARALGYDVKEAMEVTKELEPLKAFEDEDGEECIVDKMPFDQICTHYPALRTYLDKYPEILRHALVMRNQVRNTGRHAGGLIISDLDLKDKIPVFKTSDGDIVSSWAESGSASELSSVGLIKYDILGLKNLTVVSDCVKLIKSNRGIDLKKKDIPIDDHEAIKIQARSDLVGIFQFENPATREIVDAVGMDSLNDISAITSLLRPGPKDMGMDMLYADHKNGRKSFTIKECLKPILEETMNILVYQEQSMRISRVLAGFSGPEANKLRKTMGKKKLDEMVKMHNKFIKGSQPRIDSGEFTLAEVEDMWKLIESFAGYGFNKCLCPSSVVETPCGFKKMQSLVIGDQVMVPSGVFVKVVDIIDSGCKFLFRFKTSGGRLIRCTEHHKFLCYELGIAIPIIDIFKKGLSIVSENGLSEKVVYRRFIGIKPTMDITIDSDDHIFFANGLATSNSHSVAYSVLTANELWLKHNYFIEYMAALLNNTKLGDKKHGSDNLMGDYINYCRSKGLVVMSPDISNSKMGFTIENGFIRYSLSHIKGVSSAADIIVKFQPYSSMKDFVERCFEMKPGPGGKIRRHGPNTKVVDALIMSGAFSSFGGVNEMKQEYNRLKKKKDEDPLISPYHAKLQERELLGVVLSEAPLVNRYSQRIEDNRWQTVGSEGAKKNVKVLCQVDGIVECVSKAGKPMLRVDLSDGIHSMNMFVWFADKDYFKANCPVGTVAVIGMSRFEDEVPPTEEESKAFLERQKINPKEKLKVLKKIGPRYFDGRESPLIIEKARN